MGREEIYEALHPETKQGMRNGQTSKNRNLRALEAKSFAVDTAEKIGVSRATVERQIQTVKNLTPEVKEIIKGSKISKTDALKLSRLAPDQQKEAAVQLISGDIRSVDEYQPIPAKPTSPEQPEPRAPRPGIGNPLSHD